MENEPQISKLKQKNGKLKKLERPFHLLDLPRELRDLIYAQVMVNSKTAGFRNTRGAYYASITVCRALKPSLYATSSAMVLLNKQVRSEFINLFCSAPEILINVQITNSLNIKHAIDMINSWTNLPNGLLTKHPQKLTINFSLQNWEETMIHSTSSRRNKRAVAFELKKWLKIITQVSKSPNAPEIEYIPQGVASGINAFKWSWKKLDLAGEEEVECVMRL